MGLFDTLWSQNKAIVDNLESSFNTAFGTNFSKLGSSSSTPPAVSTQSPGLYDTLLNSGDSTPTDPFSDFGYLQSAVTPNSSASSNNFDALDKAFNDLKEWAGSLFKSQDQFANDNREYNAIEAEKNRKFQAEQAEIARRFNSSEAAANRNFQKMMSDTSYQRAVKDLQAAGLNPILAYTNFTGSSSPSGSSASITSPTGSAASSTSMGGINANDVFTLLISLLDTVLDGKNDFYKAVGSIIPF